MDPDIGSAAALIGDPSRARILQALADGGALPAGVLARIARISPQTASAHLDKLFRGHLLAVEVQGRHRYFRLRDSRVADLLESLSLVARRAPAVVTDEARALRFARTCYGHLAGALGVAVARALCQRDLLCEDDTAYRMTDKGYTWLRKLGIDASSLERRPFARRCLDWSERRHHLAGALGVALTTRMIELAWIVRVRDGRALRLTERGRAALRSELGLALEEPRSTSSRPAPRRA